MNLKQYPNVNLLLLNIFYKLKTIKYFVNHITFWFLPKFYVSPRRNIDDIVLCIYFYPLDAVTLL